jgi:alkanesulfonate monooxygenase SsuD/methylene tetrahydromethanopterin reductase-like flavin-dependent oxidoreductase (luciferase family)
MEIGLLTLGDVLPNPLTGAAAPTDAQRTRAIVELGVAAEGLGFDQVHLGEHHGNGYQLSAPPVVLAAIAARTSTVRLSTGVTLAANLDPVRMAEDYATLDGVSSGRAEIVAGRGSYFARTFEYLGQDPRQSKRLFAEHVELLVRLLREEDVCHPGGLRPALDHFTSRPRPEGPLPVWVGGGSSRDTLALAARLGLPLMLPSVFAPPEDFVPAAEFYREAWAEAGHAGAPQVGAVCHCHVGPTTQQARATFEPHYRQYWGWVQDLVQAYTPNAPRMDFDFETMLVGPAVCGSPAQVVERIGEWDALLGLDRIAFYFDLGGMAQASVLESIERFGTEVIPAVR